MQNCSSPETLPLRSVTGPAVARLSVLRLQLSLGEGGHLRCRSGPEARPGGAPQALALESDRQEEVAVGQAARPEGGGQAGAHAAEVGGEFGGNDRDRRRGFCSGSCPV